MTTETPLLRLHRCAIVRTPTRWPDRWPTACQGVSGLAAMAPGGRWPVRGGPPCCRPPSPYRLAYGTSVRRVPPCQVHRVTVRHAGAGLGGGGGKKGRSPRHDGDGGSGGPAGATWGCSGWHLHGLLPPTNCCCGLCMRTGLPAAGRGPCTASTAHRCFCGRSKKTGCWPLARARAPMAEGQSVQFWSRVDETKCGAHVGADVWSGGKAGGTGAATGCSPLASP